MSHVENTKILEDAQSDFDTFLSQEKNDDCRAIIDSLGEQGFEHEAMLLHQTLNRHFAGEDVTPYNPDNYRPEYPKE